jgi:hypothetical protein
LRRATLIKSAGKPLRVSSLKTASVRAFLKLLITKTLYHSLIQRSIVLYQTMIHLFALEEKQAEAFRQAKPAHRSTVGLRGLRITVTVLRRNPSVGINVPAVLGADAEAMFMLGELV